MKQFIKDYLRFSRKDRIGGICLLIIMAGAVILPDLLAPEQENLLVTTEIKGAVQALQSHNEKGSTNGEEPDFAVEYERPVSRKRELFRFDPNTATEDEWLRLGLTEKTTRTIINYRNKGGRFYKAEDLQKIWGLPPSFYERAKDFIEIKNSRPALPVFTENAPKEKRVLNIEINSADTNQLIALPGIGSKLSARIISFREKLGGFHSIEQLSETFGLPDSTFLKIRPFLRANEDLVSKININTATKDLLKAHPYIRWNGANAIVEYRNQHGEYKSLDDLKKIIVLDEPSIQKMLPYLTL